MSNVPVPPGSVRLPPRHEKFKAVQVQMLDGTWRTSIVSNRDKFNDEQKGIFLEEYAKHGMKKTAARMAQISLSTLAHHVNKDEIFAQACVGAEATYHDRLIEHVQNLIFDGTKKVNYDRTGKMVSEETIYPIRLIELEMKRVDPDYRDKREVDVNVNGGVLIAPASVESVEDWEKRFSAAKVIEGTIAEEILTEGASETDEDRGTD